MAAIQKLIFFGTGELSAEVLRALVTAGFSVAAAISQPDRPAGRGQTRRETPVKTEAQRLHLPCWQPLHVRDCLPDLLAATPVAGVLYAYGQLLPAQVLQAFSDGILNLHPSLLPRYRGPSPVIQAILDGAAVTGVSIIRLDEQLDHGPIVARVSTPVGPTETAPELLSRLVRMGTAKLLEILPAYLRGEVTLTPQNDQDASFTRMFSRDDGRIAWNQAAEVIFRQYRALQPWPGVFTSWQGKRLKLIAVAPVKKSPKPGPNAPGTVVQTPPGISVVCGRGLMALHIVQLEGKDPVRLTDFLHGHPNFLGAQLG